MTQKSLVHKPICFSLGAAAGTLLIWLPDPGSLSAVTVAENGLAALATLRDHSPEEFQLVLTVSLLCICLLGAVCMFSLRHPAYAGCDDARRGRRRAPETSP